jgi:hypothetical protein
MIPLTADEALRLIQSREDEAARLRRWAEIHRAIAAGHDEAALRATAEATAARAALSLPAAAE